MFPKPERNTLPLETASVLESFSLDLRYITPLGEGVQHTVYRYAHPDSPGNQMIKLPKKTFFGQTHGVEDEKRNQTLIEQYMPEFYVPTEIMQGNAGLYCIIMDEISGDLSQNMI